MEKMEKEKILSDVRLKTALRHYKSKVTVSLNCLIFFFVKPDIISGIQCILILFKNSLGTRIFLTRGPLGVCEGTA